MSRKFTYSEKGKAVASSSLPPLIPRIKVPDFDSTKLREKHSLTIIGRLTNPAMQRMWSLIPFFAEMWKTSSRPVGADLGQGRFQFQFANEQDLVSVLENQPYHFSRWMVILQRWEPTSSSSFPSLIPFWIDVKGIPVHLWSEETMTSVAKGAGIFERAEITGTHARVRVTVNGLQPIVKQAFVDFANGEEVLADLIYERLEKHCKKCNRLDHEDKDCPSSRPRSSEVNRSLPPPPPPPRRNPPSPPRRNNREDYPARRSDSDHSRQSQPHRYNQQEDRKRHRSPEHRRSSEHRRQYSHEDRHSKDYRRRSPEHLFGPPRHDRHRSHERHLFPRQTSSGHSFGGQKSSDYSHEKLENVRDNVVACSRSLGSKDREAYSTARVQRRSAEISQGVKLGEVPQAALNIALGELRDVMIQYVNCGDPTESAARRERYRQAEDQGQFEETAEQMVRANLQLSAGNQRERTPELSNSQERVPMSQRLGPVNAPCLAPKPKPKAKKRFTKKKLGRPPGKNKNQQKPQDSPRILAAGPTKRRRLLQPQPSPRRRLNMDSLVEGAPALIDQGQASNANPHPSEVADRDIPGQTSSGNSRRSRGSADFRSALPNLP